MATDSAVHSPPYRVLVRVSETCSGIEKKLQKYFQNTSKSGGGRCKVKGGPSKGTFWVEFLKKQGKDGMLAKKDHSVAISPTLHVNIFIEKDENPEENKTMEISQLSSKAQSLPKALPDKKRPDEGCAPSSSNSFIQKVFLHVEAKLTFKLSKDQREIIVNICPSIKIEGDDDGPEKVIGEYEDVERIYQFLNEVIRRNAQKEDSHSASDEEIEEVMPNEYNRLVLYTNPKPRTEDEFDLISVPSHLYEYFKYFVDEILEKIESEEQVHIKSTLTYPTGSVCLDFEASYSRERRVTQGALTSSFQSERQEIPEKDAHFKETNLAHDIEKTLSDMFENLHVKADEKDLILWGSPQDMLEAQHFIEENFADNQPMEIMVSQNMKNGIEVDTTHWRLLGQEVREIEKTYYTVMELVNKPKTQKTLIVFKPRDKDLDLSAHAYEDFIDIFQMLIPQIVKEVLILKPLDQKRKGWLEKTFFEYLERKHPHVHFEGNDRALTLTGLPKYLAKAKKYIKRYFSIESPAQQKKDSALSTHGEN